MASRKRLYTSFWTSGFVILSDFDIRNSSFTSSAVPSSLQNRKHVLLLRLLGLLLPFPDAIVVDAAEGQELFLVVNHLFAAGSGERVILHQEDRFFGTNLLAIAAENAAEHVNLKFFR